MVGQIARAGKDGEGSDEDAPTTAIVNEVIHYANATGGNFRMVPENVEHI
jgi:hypothetical protein